MALVSVTLSPDHDWRRVTVSASRAFAALLVAGSVLAGSAALAPAATAAPKSTVKVSVAKDSGKTGHLRDASTGHLRSVVTGHLR